MNTIYDDLRAALYSIWYRRWLALAVAWAVCLLGWLIVALIPNKYESTARLFVQMDDALSEVTGVGVGDRKRDIDRVQQTLTSAVNLEKVIRSTAIGEDAASPKQMEVAVLDLAKQVKVENVKDNLFKITAEFGEGARSDSENAKIATEIVQKLIDIFREENLAGNRGEMTQSLEFMDQQLADRQKELEAAEQRRLAFEAENPDLIQGGASSLQRLEASRVELRGIDADLAAAQSAMAAINGQLAGTPQSLPAMAGQGGARGALAEAQALLSGLRARGLTENHPDVISARNQVKTLRAAAANEGGPAGMPNPAYSSLVSIKAERQATVQGLLSTPISIPALVLSKLLPYYVLGLASTAICVAVAVLGYGLPFRGSYLALFLVASAFLAAVLGQGLLISAGTKNQFVSTQFALLSGFLPSLLLSGFLFEIDSMPRAIQWLTYIVPARYLIPPLQSVFLVGDVWSMFLPNILAMFGFGLFFFLRVTRAIKRQIV